jgi:hypothetical protein
MNPLQAKISIDMNKKAKQKFRFFRGLINAKRNLSVKVDGQRVLTPLLLPVVNVFLKKVAFFGKNHGIFRKNHLQTILNLRVMLKTVLGCSLPFLLGRQYFHDRLSPWYCIAPIIMTHSVPPCAFSTPPSIPRSSGKDRTELLLLV